VGTRRGAVGAAADNSGITAAINSGKIEFALGRTESGVESGTWQNHFCINSGRRAAVNAEVPKKAHKINRLRAMAAARRMHHFRIHNVKERCRL
jgi:hypothetical protein